MVYKYILPLLLMLVVCIASFGSYAETHKVLKDDSFLQYHAQVNNTPVSGKFTDYDAHIEFYPNDLERSYIQVTVYVGRDSIASEHHDTVDTLIAKGWLNSERFPVAVFESRDIERATHSTFRGFGRLTLLGKTNPITYYLILNSNAQGQQIADAVFTMNRSDWGIGVEQLATNFGVAIIDDVVTLNAHLVTEIQ